LLIQLGDWELDVDVKTNMSFSVAQAQDNCRCAYCCNYYGAVDSAYPNLRPFLMEYGVDINGPDELSPFEPTIYEAVYIINGIILKKGTNNIRVDGIPVIIRDSADSDMETERPLPYFTFTVGLMELPWIMDEPMDEVVSPANEEAYMQRMWKKLLLRMSDEGIQS